MVLYLFNFSLDETISCSHVVNGNVNIDCYYVVVVVVAVILTSFV
jgi:hypothetical protein